MAKLLRQVFAVWTKDCDFDPDFESRPKAIAESATTESVAEEFPPTDPAACEMKTVVGHKKAVKPHRKVVTTTGGKISPATTAINEPTPVLARAGDRLTTSPRRSHRDILTLPGETESSSAEEQLDKG
jgi:hypothetical protein